MVDAAAPAIAEAVQPLVDLLAGRRVVVLAGAGCSTESGIPDYRGPEGSLRTRKPIQYQEFVRSEAARLRYWARGTVGWRRFSAAQPNDAHLALARLEAAGVVRGIITQNVDGLHHAAGSARVVELHGSLAAVRCLDCGARTSRDALQALLLDANPRFAAGVTAELAPDGDAELPAEMMEDFRVPGCASCGGMMKPDVVFFGENVPRDVVATAQDHLAEADAMLIVGSSLMVYSGFRFVQAAAQRQIPIAAVNLGRTRADDLLTLKVEERCEAALTFLL